MKKIYKYPLQLADTQMIEIPKYAKILDAQLQGDDLFIWALVNLDYPAESKKIFIFGTGFELPDDLYCHISTVQIKGFVWHVFQEGYLDL